MLFVYFYFLLLYHYDFVLFNLLIKLEIMQSLICQLPKENQYFLQKPPKPQKPVKTPQNPGFLPTLLLFPNHVRVELRLIWMQVAWLRHTQALTLYSLMNLISWTHGFSSQRLNFYALSAFLYVNTILAHEFSWLTKV